MDETISQKSALNKQCGFSVTYQMQGSYNTHSFDSVSDVKVLILPQIAGNGRFPVPAGT